MSGLAPGALFTGRINFLPLATAKRSGLPRSLTLQFRQPLLELLILVRQTVRPFQHLTETLPQLPILLLEPSDR